jgi:heme A synthase
MTSHLLLMIVFALLVSTVFAVLLHDAPRDQVRTGARMFAAFVGVGLLLGWVMFPFPL